MINTLNMFAVWKDLTVNKSVGIFADKAVPVDGTTGTKLAGKGSLYIDTLNGVLYINTGTPAATIWVKVGTQT